MIFKEVKYKNSNTKFHWEEVPQEELWEDGELEFSEVQNKTIDHLFVQGDWILIREVEHG